MPSQSKGIIAAGHAETAKAGAEILRAGGNAFDAALSAMLVSFIAEASLTSMGGGGFLNAWTGSHTDSALKSTRTDTRKYWYNPCYIYVSKWTKTSSRAL